MKKSKTCKGQLLLSIVGFENAMIAHNGLELSCPAEAGKPFPPYVTPAGETRTTQGPDRRVSFSELFGGTPLYRRSSSRGGRLDAVR
jgi:hypothetical protein